MKSIYLGRAVQNHPIYGVGLHLSITLHKPKNLALKMLLRWRG